MKITEVAFNGQRYAAGMKMLCPLLKGICPYFRGLYDESQDRGEEDWIECPFGSREDGNGEVEISCSLTGCIRYDTLSEGHYIAVGGIGNFGLLEVSLNG